MLASSTPARDLTRAPEQPQYPQTAPALPSRQALEVVLTGYTITGQPGPFGSVAVPGAGCWPAGPYTITDASGARVGIAHLPWQARAVAIRQWRERCAAIPDTVYLTPDLRRQAALKVRIREHEAHIAALEAEIAAIDAAAGDDLWHLEHALGQYEETLKARDTARAEAVAVDDAAVAA